MSTLWVASVRAGDIPGIPVMQPPSLMGDVQVQIANDFLSSLNVDDFRTQQISISGWVADNWLISVDQSIMTVRGLQGAGTAAVGLQGRLDQLSASIGYRLYQNYGRYGAALNELLLGGGLRSYGNYQGARIQNGFHYIFHSSIVRLPYVETSYTDAVIWLRGSHEVMFDAENIMQNTSYWRYGYWLDGSVLVTTRGQTDGSLGLYGLARYQEMALWAGIRGDLRLGYNQDFVQKLTAENERGLALAIGLSIGPVRIETVEGLGDNTNGFGRIVFTSSRKFPLDINTQNTYVAYQFSFLLPTAGVQHQLRWLPDSWDLGEKDYRLAAVLDYRYTSPADDDLATKFIIGDQMLLGIEASYNTHSTESWFSPYIMLGVGYRSEVIEGKAAFDGQKSRKVGSTVIVLDAGARFNMAGDEDQWLIQLQLGTTGWLPINEQQVEFNHQSETLLNPGLSLSIGVSAVLKL